MTMELNFTGNGRALTVRRITVGNRVRGWRVTEKEEYLFQFTTKLKAIAYAKKLTGGA